jgi:CubicO group peptidase (beta-lactamase class C family)
MLDRTVLRATRRAVRWSSRVSCCIAISAVCAAPLRAQRTVPLGPTVSTALPASKAPALPKPEPAGTALTAADVNAWLDGYMPYALKTGDIAGAVVAVVKNGQILTVRGYGFSDIDKRTPVDPKATLFRPGSVSKLVTWTAVMQQVEAGKIDLDADVNRYLDFTIPPRAGKPVTMRNLMQHVAGFEEQSKDIMSTDPNGVPSYDALLKRWTPTRIYDAGTTPAYSNYGASLAGYIVQRVSGEPFATYVERHIFTPLDMTHSSFRQPLPANLAPLMSKGYTEASKKPSGFEIVGPAPAGSLSSTGEDMAHFMIAHLQNGAYQGHRILQPATAQMMHDSPLTLLPPLNRMELGFFETNINGREVIAHLGDTEDFHTSLHLFLNDSVGFYVSFNSLGKGGAAGGLRGALFQDFADRYLPSTERDGRVDDSTAAKHAAMLAGTWVNSRRSESNFISAVGLVSQMKIGARKGEIILPLPGLNGQPRKWVEVAPFVWRDAGSHERLGAKVVDGKVVRWSIDELSPFMVFDRTPWYQNSVWLLPFFCVALAALAITALRWPIAAMVRRHYGVTLSLDARARRAYRWSRIAAIAIVVAMLGWAAAIGMLLSDIDRLNSKADGIIWFLELFGIVAFFGGLAVMLWNLWVVWTGQRRWPARTWSVVMTLSAVMVAWVAVAFKLTSFGANY